MMAFVFSSTACLPSLFIPERLVGLKAGAFARQRMDYVHARKIRKPMFRAVLGSNPSKSATENDRKDYDLPPPGCNRFKVELSKPLGIILEEDKSGNIFVAELVKDGNADKNGLVGVGDQLIATSAVVYGNIENYQGVRVRKGMEMVRLNVRGERFETVMAAIGTHPGHIKPNDHCILVQPSVSCRKTVSSGGEETQPEKGESRAAMKGFTAVTLQVEEQAT